MPQEVFINLLHAGNLPIPAEGKKIAERFVKEVAACKAEQDKAKAHLEGLKSSKRAAQLHAHKAIVIGDMLYEEYKDDPAVKATVEKASAVETQPAHVDEIPQPVVDTGLKVAKGHKKK